MKYNFMWASPSAGAPIVSIASYGISFNAAVIDLLKRPHSVGIGFDEQNKVIGIMPLSYEEAHEIKAFPFAQRERNGYVRIGNKDFVRYVANKAGLDLRRAVRYAASWDDEENMLIVELDKPLDDKPAEE